MKYLYLIIRHFFPKKPILKWEVFHIIDHENKDGAIWKKTWVLRNQFGELKNFSSND